MNYDPYDGTQLCALRSDPTGRFIAITDDYEEPIVIVVLRWFRMLLIGR